MQPGHGRLHGQERAASLDGISEAVQRALKVLGQLVGIPTWEDETKALRFLAEWLAAWGISTELHQDDDHPLALVATVGDPRSQGISGPRGSASPCLIFNTHIDTVPPAAPEKWRYPPLRLTREGDTLYGLGVCDAKGCVAAMSSAFIELARTWQGPSALQLMIVGGEERGGLGTRMELRRGTQGSVIIGEPTSMIPRLASKGVLRLEVTSLGRPSHASNPEQGFNAIYPMVTFLRELQELAVKVRQREDRWTGRASLEVTLITGGTAHNVIPASCSVHIDRRLVPGESAADAEAEIRAVADRVVRKHPGSVFEVHRVRALEPVLVPQEETIVRVAVEAAARLSPPPPVLLGGFPASCDLTWVVYEGGLPAVVWGPGDLEQAHRIDESLPVMQLEQAVEGYVIAGLLWQQRWA